MRHDYYRLDGHEAVPCDLHEWATAFKGPRHVAIYEFGDTKVSTVFLGLDHGYGDGPPVLFETMVFGGPHDGHQERASTWDEAQCMHDAVVRIVTAGK